MKLLRSPSRKKTKPNRQTLEVEKNTIISARKSLPLLLWIIYLSTQSLLGLSLFVPGNSFTFFPRLINVLDISFGAFLIFRKETWKNISFVALAVYLLMEGVVRGVFEYYNYHQYVFDSLLKSIGDFSGVIAFITAILFATQRNNWKNWGIITTIIFLTVIALSPFLISMNIDYRVVAGIFAFGSAVLLFFGK